MAVTKIRGNTQIIADTITNSEINTSAGIELSKLESVTSGNILVGNGSNVLTSVNPSGDIDVDNTGVFSINAGVIVDADINASAAISLSKLAEAVIQADGGQAFTADQSMGSNKLTNVATPTASTDAATKGYVDAIEQGLDIKDSVRLATDSALPANTAAGSGVGKTLTGDVNGALSVDGIAVAASDRILVKDESTTSDNGIYTVTQTGDGSNPFILTRATDADEDSEVTAGLFTFVAEGTANADSGWVLTTDDPITVDTTGLTFTQFSDAGQVSAGAGLTKTGSTLDVGDANKGVQVNADDLEIDGSEIAGNGLAEDGTNSWQLVVNPDSTTGATVAPLSVTSNGAGVTVDNSTITHSGGTISVGTISTSNISDIVSSTPSSGQVLIYDGTDSYDNQSISGDATLSNAGVLTLASDVLKEADIVTREVPSGLINGVNTTYTLANTPVSGTEHVYLNGILQNEGATNDYTISGGTITYNTAPASGDVLLVSYWK